MADHDGHFIVFEGLDGAGTTTQAERLTATLRADKRVVHLTCEPTGGPIGSLIRQALSERVNLASSHMAATMALLFAADRLDHLACEIEPHLRDGAIVVCDRYELSSIVYQSATAPPSMGDDESVPAWIRTLNRFALQPDLTLLLEVDPARAERRRGARARARELYEETALQERIAALYARADELAPGAPLCRIDGNRSVDEVASDVLAAVRPLIDRQ